MAQKIEDHVLAKIAMEKNFLSATQVREAYRELGRRMAGNKAKTIPTLFPILLERGYITKTQYEEALKIASWLMGQLEEPQEQDPITLDAPRPADPEDDGEYATDATMIYNPPPKPAPKPVPAKPAPKAAPKPVPKKAPAAAKKPDPPKPVEEPLPTPSEYMMATEGTEVDLPVVRVDPNIEKTVKARSQDSLAAAFSPTAMAPSVKVDAKGKPIPGAGAASTRLAARPKEVPPEVVEAAKDPDYVFDDFVLTSELGKGGMGVVWKAWQTSLKRWVAVKFLNSKDETELRRFFQEARTVLSLNHPNIARLFKLSKYQEMYYLVMEFVEGRALQQVLGQFDDGAAARAIRDSALALQHAHEMGIIHRDIKPQNIMITDDAAVFVMDFGLARHNANESRHTVSGMVLGTPSFMSPEQAEGKFKKVDARSDVCSLGATLYSLLSGRPPFVGRTVMDTLYKVVHTEPVPISHFNAHVSPELEKIVACAMKKEPLQRYQSAKEMADDLERFLEGTPVKGRSSVGRTSAIGRASTGGRPPLPSRPPLRRK